MSDLKCFKLFDCSLNKNWQCFFVIIVVGFIVLTLLSLTVIFGISRRRLYLKYLRLKEELKNNNATVESAEENSIGAESKEAEVTSAISLNQIEFDGENAKLVRNLSRNVNIQTKQEEAEECTRNNSEKENGVSNFSKQKSFECIELSVDMNLSKKAAANEENTNENESNDVEEENKNKFQDQRKLNQEQRKLNTQQYENTVINRQERDVSSSFTLSSTNEQSDTPYILAMKAASTDSPFKLTTDVIESEEVIPNQISPSNSSTTPSSFTISTNNLASDTPYALAMKNAGPESPYSVASAVADLSQLNDPTVQINVCYDRLFSSQPREDSLAYDNVILPDRHTVKSKKQTSILDSEDNELPPPPVPPPYISSDDEDNDINTAKEENVYDLPS